MSTPREIWEYNRSTSLNHHQLLQEDVTVADLSGKIIEKGGGWKTCEVAFSLVNAQLADVPLPMADIIDENDETLVNPFLKKGQDCNEKKYIVQDKASLESVKKFLALVMAEYFESPIDSETAEATEEATFKLIPYSDPNEWRYAKVFGDFIDAQNKKIERFAHKIPLPSDEVPENEDFIQFLFDRLRETLMEEKFYEERPSVAGGGFDFIEHTVTLKGFIVFGIALSKWTLPIDVIDVYKYSPDQCKYAYWECVTQLCRLLTAPVRAMLMPLYDEECKGSFYEMYVKVLELEAKVIDAPNQRSLGCINGAYAHLFSFQRRGFENLQEALEKEQNEKMTGQTEQEGGIAEQENIMTEQEGEEAISEISGV